MQKFHKNYKLMEPSNTWRRIIPWPSCGFPPKEYKVGIALELHSPLPGPCQLWPLSYSSFFKTQHMFTARKLYQPIFSLQNLGFWQASDLVLSLFLPVQAGSVTAGIIFSKPLWGSRVCHGGPHVHTKGSSTGLCWTTPSIPHFCWDG